MTILENYTVKISDRSLSNLIKEQEQLLSLKNTISSYSNGIFERWSNPIVTRDHIPLNWRFDFNPATNPYLMERIGVNATFNSGAIFWQGKYILIVRVEGNDRKSYFAVAESDTGVDNFRFWERPITIPQTQTADTNVYDMRVVSHEDGYIYGLFCTERKDTSAPQDLSAAVAQCAIARTKDLINWERLPDLITYSGQQRNVVLHPEFFDGQYALYTRPQQGFINVGSGGGIGWGLTRFMESAQIKHERIVDPRVYHTISEVKNGLGPAPIKTEQGWLHLAHGVRNTVAGLRYVLYMFMTDLKEPWKIIYKPAGHLIAPQGNERVGDVSNVAFSNGWICNGNTVFIYYASSDTRMHVATSTVERLVDYCMHTAEDGLSSSASVNNVNQLIDNNQSYLKDL